MLMQICESRLHHVFVAEGVAPWQCPCQVRIMCGARIFDFCPSQPVMACPWLLCAKVVASGMSWGHDVDVQSFAGPISLSHACMQGAYCARKFPMPLIQNMDRDAAPFTNMRSRADHSPPELQVSRELPAPHLCLHLRTCLRAHARYRLLEEFAGFSNMLNLSAKHT